MNDKEKDLKRLDEWYNIIRGRVEQGDSIISFERQKTYDYDDQRVVFLLDTRVIKFTSIDHIMVDKPA